MTTTNIQPQETYRAEMIKGGGCSVRSTDGKIHLNSPLQEDPLKIRYSNYPSEEAKAADILAIQAAGEGRKRNVKSLKAALVSLKKLIDDEYEIRAKLRNAKLITTYEGEDRTEDVKALLEQDIKYIHPVIMTLELVERSISAYLKSRSKKNLELLIAALVVHPEKDRPEILDAYFEYFPV